MVAPLVRDCHVILFLACQNLPFSQSLSSCMICGRSLQGYQQRGARLFKQGCCCSHHGPDGRYLLAANVQEKLAREREKRRDEEREAEAADRAEREARRRTREKAEKAERDARAERERKERSEREAAQKRRAECVLAHAHSTPSG